MTWRPLIAAAFVALVVAGARGQQSQIPPPTVPPPTPPTTTPVGPGQRVVPQPTPRPGLPAVQVINSSIVVIGQVVDATSGRAVPKAIVRLTGPGLRQTRVCDDKGRFFFRDLPANDVIITASKSGFIDGAYGQRRASGAPAPLSLVAGRWMPDLRIELFRQAAISGVVVDEANEAVAGARVIARQRRFTAGVWRDQQVGSTATDDEGMYRLVGLTPGDYIIVTPTTQVSLPVALLEAIASTGNVAGAVSSAMRIAGLFDKGAQAMIATARFTRDGQHIYWSGEPTTPPPIEEHDTAYPTQYYPATDRPSMAMRVTVVPGEDRRGVNFQLRPVPAARITGHVIGPDGPLADELVRLIPAEMDDPGSGGEIAVTATSPGGGFSLINIPAGRYVVTVGDPVFLPASAPASATDTVSLSRAQYWGSTTVVVENQNVDDVIVSVEPGATLAGELTAQPRGTQPAPGGPLFSRIAISIDAVAGPSRGVSIPISLTEDGTFQAAGLPPGQYFIRVGSLPPGWYLDDIQSGGPRGMDEPISLESGDAESVLITLTDRRTVVAGAVRDMSLRPIPGATVIMMPATSTSDIAWNPNRVREARAASDGMFVISGLPPGDYLAVAVNDADADGWQAPAVLAVLRRAATRVTVRANSTSPLDLRVTPVRAAVRLVDGLQSGSLPSKFHEPESKHQVPR